MYDFDKIQTVLQNEKKYRLKQVDKLIFQDLISDWQEATILPQELRQLLNKQIPLVIEAETRTSQDNKTIKVLLTLSDGLKIETVLMRYENRNTVCISCQVGCPMGCTFCATGKMGFTRNLTTLEIINQVLFFSRMLKKENQKINNIVFMGMGEPFLNYNNVLKAIYVLNDPFKMGLGARRFSISTSGIVDGIEKLTNEKLEINLALSLHAPNDKLRSQLMPVNKQYPLADVLNALEKYVKKTRAKVLIEYVLLKNINDTEECARQLAVILKHPLYHLNLIQYNETGMYEPSTKEQTEKFKKVLLQKGIFFTERFRFGRDISAACGQLATLKDF